MTTDGQVQKYMEMMAQELDQERLRRMQMENQVGQVSAFSPEKEPNLVEYQLDLKEELDRIYHLLSGHFLTVNAEGSEVWIEPDDDRLKIFSEYGVKQIMNIISFYVNRNTLMSFYDSETITWKMRDFGVELSDLIYNRYESFFHYPSPEELFEKYKPVVQRNQLEISDEELYQKCIVWSREELQSKLRHYPMVILALIDTVHSTYLRALHGKERQSLRERLNISQSTNHMGELQPQGPVAKKTNIFNPKTW